MLRGRMTFYPKPNITDAAAILLIIVALPLAAGLYGYFDGKRAGAKSVRAEWASANAAALVQARTVEEGFATQLKEAKDAAAKNEQTLLADARALGRSNDGLRDTVAKLQRAVRKEPASASADAAIASSQLLLECSKEYSSMAEIAARHAADVAHLIHAWPVTPSKSPYTLF